MPPQLFSPITVRFTGMDADKHFLDAEQIGKSICGTAKLYNNAIYLLQSGEAPAARSLYQVKMQVEAQPITKGSVSYAVWACMQVGQIAMFPALWGELADVIVPDVVKAIYAKIVHRDNEVMQVYQHMVEVLQEERNRERDHSMQTQTLFVNALLSSQERFLETIERTADFSRGAARSSVEPIGQSSTAMEHQSKAKTMLTIDEPTADAIRSKEQLEVTDQLDSVVMRC